MEAELRLLYSLHATRFGTWALSVARDGPWKLALDVAERERAAGEPLDMEVLDHIFWWPGNPAFLQRLHVHGEEDGRLGRAFDRLAQVRDRSAPAVSLVWAAVAHRTC